MEDFTNTCVGCSNYHKFNCSILSERNREGRTREQFIPNCPCRVCLVKITCPQFNRQYLFRGTRTCPEFNEFLGTIVDYYFEKWEKGHLSHIKPITFDKDL